MKKMNGSLLFGSACVTALALVCTLASVPGRAAELVEARFELAITNGNLPPASRVLRVRRGERVRLRVTSDAQGELHLHAYRQQTTVVPGRIAELGFSAHATGRFRIEWHPTGDKGMGGHAHGPAIATLEVRPE